MELGSSISVEGLVTAIGLGLMIGVVRERLHAKDGATIAGIRTHALVAIVSAVAASFGVAVLVVALLMIGGLAIASYLRTASKDPGLTGEVALMVTALLAALAQRDAILAAGLGVVVAALLFAKRPLHRFALDVISERELQEALLLGGAALVVLPLLPGTAVDPWGVLVPSVLWRLVVLVMAVGMLGHIALRGVGARWGFPVAGFFAGFASSTAAVAGFGQRAKATPSLRRQAVAAALLSCLSSLLLFAAVVGAGAPTLLQGFAWPLVAAAAVLLAGGTLGLAGGGDTALPEEPTPRSFQVRHALMLAALIAALLLLSAWLQRSLGTAGALVASTCVALAELHAAAASVSQLFAAGGLSRGAARLGLLALLCASTLAKTLVAVVSGGPAYGLRVGIGLAGMVGAAAAATWAMPP